MWVILFSHSMTFPDQEVIDMPVRGQSHDRDGDKAIFPVRIGDKCNSRDISASLDFDSIIGKSRDGLSPMLNPAPKCSSN
jgi:hypothetical protein